MLPDSRFNLENAPQGLRRRLLTDRNGKPRATRFTPTEWPRSRGPTPNPRSH